MKTLWPNTRTSLWHEASHVLDSLAIVGWSMLGLVLLVLLVSVLLPPVQYWFQHMLGV